MFRRSAKRESFETKEHGTNTNANMQKMGASLVLDQPPTQPLKDDYKSSNFDIANRVPDSQVNRREALEKSVGVDHQKTQQTNKTDIVSSKTVSQSTTSPVFSSLNIQKPSIATPSLFLSSTHNPLRAKPSVTSIERKHSIDGQIGGFSSEWLFNKSHSEKQIQEKVQTQNIQNGLSNGGLGSGPALDIIWYNTRKSSNEMGIIDKGFSNLPISDPGFNQVDSHLSNQLRKPNEQSENKLNVQTQKEQVVVCPKHDAEVKRIKVLLPVSHLNQKGSEVGELKQAVKAEMTESKMANPVHKGFTLKANQQAVYDHSEWFVHKTEAPRANPSFEKAQTLPWNHLVTSFESPKVSSAESKQANDKSPGSFRFRHSVDRLESQPIKPFQGNVARIEETLAKDTHGQLARLTPTTLPSLATPIDARLLNYHSVTKEPSRNQLAEEQSHQKRTSSPPFVESKSRKSPQATHPDGQFSPENTGLHSGPRKSILKKRNSNRKSKNFSKSVKINEEMNTNHHVDKYLAQECLFVRDGSYFDSLRSRQPTNPSHSHQWNIVQGSFAFSRPGFASNSFHCQGFGLK